jgi:hypothetical protein
MSYCFIISSCLNAKVGQIDHESRFQQTLKTISSIKNKVTESIIIFVDSSPTPIEDYKISTIKGQVDHFVVLSNHSRALEMSEHGLKTPGEAYNMIVALDIIRTFNPENVKRIFKITGRAELTDDFHIEDYENENLKGKYVFKNRNKSWMSPALELIDTRFWSFDYELLEEVADLMIKVYNEFFSTNWDIEHLILKIINKDKLVEKKILGLKCQVSSDGRIQYD